MIQTLLFIWITKKVVLPAKYLLHMIFQETNLWLLNFQKIMFHKINLYIINLKYKCILAKWLGYLELNVQKQIKKNKNLALVIFQIKDYFI